MKGLLRDCCETAARLLRDCCEEWPEARDEWPEVAGSAHSNRATRTQVHAGADVWTGVRCVPSLTNEGNLPYTFVAAHRWQCRPVKQ